VAVWGIEESPLSHPAPAPSCWWLPLSLALLCVAPPLLAEPLAVELSDDVDRARPPFFHVGGDDSRVAFRTVATGEIVSVPIEGGEAADLTPPGTEAAALVDLAPDGSRVLMTARFPGALTELFSAPLAGGAVTKLNPDLAAGVSAFAGPITPDSTRVVYGTRTECVLLPPSLVSCPVELFAVPLAGGASTPLDVPDLPLDGPLDLMRLFSISPDSQVGVSALLERLDEDNSFDPDPVVLFSTPLGGGPSTFLHERNWFNPPFVFTSDSQRVVYNGAGFVGNPRVVELHSVSVAGGEPATLNGTLAFPGSPLRFAITPDGSRVIYGAHQDRDVLEIYSVPSAGGPTTKLSHPDGMYGAFPFQMAPDGERVVFVQWIGSEQILFSVPVEGGEITRLSPPLVPDAPGDFDSIRPIAAIQVSADGARVVYAAQQDTDDRWDLYSAPVGGGPVTRLGGPVARAGGASESVDSRFRISPDGTRVVFVVDSTDNSFDGLFELYSVPIGGGVTTRLSAPLEPGQNIFPSSLQIAPDSRHVLFLVADELHSARLAPEIRIDVRPGAGAKPLPTARNALLAVALLGSADVDVAEVELETLAFGPSGAEPQPKTKRVDVDRDGFTDLVTRYRLEETGIVSGDTEACLSGSYDGFAFRSCDAIVTR